MILLEDTPRNNLARWATSAVNQGLVDGVVISPFTTSTVSTTYKPDVRRLVSRLRDEGVSTIWLDPSTHALGMPLVGDFRYYDRWELWGSARGDVSTEAAQREHIRRVFELQRSLDLPLLGPTILLHSLGSPDSQLALDLAHHAASLAQEYGQRSFLTIAGSATFWAAGDSLDAHVGALAQVGATGHWLVQARYEPSLPVGTTPEEVAGLCRTARSLSGAGLVHISHGDLAAYPALAAGADSVGTGWDSRQRACAYSNYVEREPSPGGGGWFQRPTHVGLMGFLARADAELLAVRDTPLSERLVPGPLPAPGPQETWEHHARCLREMTDLLVASEVDARYQQAVTRYAEATAAWGEVAARIDVTSDATSWIDPFLEGLTLYGAEEGY